MASEKRLVDAIYLTSQMYLICEVCQTENIFIDAIIDEIDNAPDVDAVEVVRCKDCIHENMTTCPLCWIENHTMHFINHNADDFCSYGERKNEQS